MHYGWIRIEGDWVIVYDNSLDHQHNLIQQFAQLWLRPYRFENKTYEQGQLNGTILWVHKAGKEVKIFKKLSHMEPCITLDNTNTE